jgi:hypothetical protein
MKRWRERERGKRDIERERGEGEREREGNINRVGGKEGEGGSKTFQKTKGILWLDLMVRKRNKILTHVLTQYNVNTVL